MSEQVTVYVDSDEWYPVWSAEMKREGKREPYGDPCQVDRETAERWERIFREFEAAQKEIAALAKASGHY